MGCLRMWWRLQSCPNHPPILQQGLLCCSSFPPPPPLLPSSSPSAGLLSEFLEVLQGIVPAPMDAEGGEAAATEPAAQLDKQALLYCERFVEFLTDLLSQARRGRAAEGAGCLLAVWCSVLSARLLLEADAHRKK